MPATCPCDYLNAFTVTGPNDLLTQAETTAFLAHHYTLSALQVVVIGAQRASNCLYSQNSAHGGPAGCSKTPFFPVLPHGTVTGFLHTVSDCKDV